MPHLPPVPPSQPSRIWCRPPGHLALCHNRSRGRGGSAFYQATWDGRDDQGELVGPGLYIYRVVVEAGSGSEERLGHIAVAY